MPEWLEKKLRRQGKKKGLKGKKLDAYVYGAMANLDNKYRKRVMGVK